jgi:glycopeptide antibiotics resistance protein
MNQNRKSNRETTSADRLSMVLLIVYMLVLFWILLFKLGVRFSYMENRQLNLIPFHELFFPNGKIDFAEIISNVVIFIPLGVYSGVLFKKWSFGTKFLSFFLTSLTLEGLQFSLAIGAFDITDLITNTLGGLVGLVLLQTLESLFGNRNKAQKFINHLALVCTVLMITFLVLLKLSLLPIKYQ